MLHEQNFIAVTGAYNTRCDIIVIVNKGTADVNTIENSSKFENNVLNPMK